MISYIQAILLGLAQGVTELFPISSLGHSVLLPPILGWHINESSPYFLTFLVATHLATALVLLGFFFKDWVLIVKGLFRSFKVRTVQEDDTYARLGWLLVVGTIPAGILGVLFQQKLQLLFASPKIVAVFLVLNGFMLYFAEWLKKDKKEEGSSTNVDEKLGKLSWASSVKIGLAQCLALLPGFSRTGATLGEGLFLGLSHEEAARFSFLLATPIILGAAVLKLPELVGANSSIIVPTIIGFISAGIGAYFSVRFLTKYFQTKSLRPFAAYCVAIGIVGLLFLTF